LRRRVRLSRRASSTLICTMLAPATAHPRKTATGNSGENRATSESGYSALMNRLVTLSVRSQRKGEFAMPRSHVLLTLILGFFGMLPLSGTRTSDKWFRTSSRSRGELMSWGGLPNRDGMSAKGQCLSSVAAEYFIAIRHYLSEMTKLTTAIPFPFTETFFSQVFGGVKTGR